MRDFYGSVGFSCAMMGLIAFVVLASRSASAEERVEAGVRGSTVAASAVAEGNLVEASPAELPQIASWGEQARLAASRVAAKYGAPDEATAEFLVWRRREPWKRIVVRRDAVSHSFPAQHTDYLEQTISYRVPPQKFSELALFDGGVLADRARGELTARSDREEANFLALNLADEISRGKLTAPEARGRAAKTLAMALSGRTSAYTSGLLFPLTRTGASDPDVVLAPAEDEPEAKTDKTK